MFSKPWRAWGFRPRFFYARYAISSGHNKYSIVSTGNCHPWIVVNNLGIKSLSLPNDVLTYPHARTSSIPLGRIRFNLLVGQARSFKLQQI